MPTQSQSEILQKKLSFLPNTAPNYVKVKIPVISEETPRTNVHTVNISNLTPELHLTRNTHGKYILRSDAL